MADFVQDGVYKSGLLISDNFMQDIYTCPYIDELLSTLRSQGDIEEFIRQKDEKRRTDFISFDVSISANRESIKNYEKQSVETEQKLKLLEEQKQTASILKEKIGKVAAAYPDNRQKDLTKALSAYAANGDIPDYLQATLTASPKGFFDKFKNGKKIEKANKEFAELMQYCKDNHISDAKKSSNYLYDAVLRGEDTSGILKKINENVLSLSEKKNGLQTSIQLSQDRIQTWIDDYDNNPDNIQNRKTENDNIRSFAKEKAPYITAPPAITKEEIAAHGLSEDFIEGQIMQSKCPGHVRASVRRFYEGLDRPAAPMVAFKGRDIPDEQGRLPQDDVLDLLKAKGFDAVKATDERAKDPNVFVVDKGAVHSPFMAPDEALKTNIQILEALHESPLVTRNYLSNPLTREALVPATDNKFGINLEVKDIIQHNGCNFQKILSEYTKEKPYQTLYDVVMSFKDKDKMLYKDIASDIHDNYNKIVSARDLLPDDMDKIGHNLLQKYEKQLFPHILDFYLTQMTKEAYDKGTSSEILDDNLRDLETTGVLKSVFHGGSCNSPYAVLCKEDNMNFIYGAGAGRGTTVVINGKEQFPFGALKYACGSSSHNSRQQIHGNLRCGFLFEYESRGKKQEFIGIDRGGMVNSWSGGTFDVNSVSRAQDETPILPHQNKLKKMYVVPYSQTEKVRLLPLELDENGVIKDKKWRDFCEMHNPVDDNLKGYMVERRNNMIADYDTTGKEQMMLRHSPIATQTKVTEKAAETVQPEKMSTEKDKIKMKNIILQKQGRLQAEQHHPIQRQAAQQNNFNLQQRAVQQGRN